MHKQLDAIITTATGFDLPLKDEPKNVVIIDKEDLQDKGYTNLEDALEKSSIITFVAGPQGTKNIDIRGQGMDAARAVKILINRVPINLQDNGNPSSAHGGTSVTPFNQIAIDDIESIEIIPGGGAVVYGNGTRGGVVNIITKKPSRDYVRFNMRGNVYSADSSLKDNFKNTLGGGAGISGGKALSDKLFLSLSADYNHQKGTRPTEYTKNAYGALSLIYQIAHNQKLDVNVSYSKMWRFFAGYSQMAPCLATNGLGTCLRYGDFKSYSELKKDRYALPSGIGSSTNSNGEVTQDFIQTSINYNANFDSFDFSVIGFYQFSNFLFPSAELGGDTKNTFTNQGTGLNFKLKHQGLKNMWLLGLDNQVELADTWSDSSSVKRRIKGQKYAISLYGLDSYKFNDVFALSGGLRGDFSYFDMQGHTGMSFDNRYNGFFETDVGKAQYGYAFELTPSFNYSDTGSVYIKAEVGYISPSARQITSSDPNWAYRNQTGVSPKIASNIKPEQYFTGEIGMRDYFSHSSVSATAFYTHTLNEIRHVLNGFNTEYFNLGKTQRAGIELSARQNLFDILDLSEGISYLYTNVLDGKPNSTGSGNSSGSNGRFIEGKPIPYAPLFKITLLADVELLNMGNNRLNVWINNSFLGKQVDLNQLVMNKNGYLLSDIGLNYRYKDLSLSAGVRNVFDTFYIAYQSSSYSSTAGYSATYLAGAGRSYFVDLRYSF